MNFATCPVLTFVRTQTVFGLWKNWSGAEKKEWILSFLVSGGTDYSVEIEQERLEKLKGG